MQIRNTPDSYGAVTKTLHWVIAVFIIGLICVGLYMGGLPDNPAKFKVYALHKSLGVTVLALALCRIFWHLWVGKPDVSATIKPYERLLAKIAHGLLYVLMVAMPVSGILMSNAANFPINVFGLFVLPAWISPDRDLAHTLVELHEAMGFTLIGVVGLHAAGALKHHIIDKDATLRRMLPALAAGILLATPAQAAEMRWNMVKEQSQLTFTAQQAGASFTGSFDKFTTDITFDPDHLDKAVVRATIDLASVDTQSVNRDTDLKGADWFDTAKFPTARFEARNFLKIGEDTYQAKGNLTIKDVTVPVSMVFSLRFSGDSDKGQTAIVDGLTNLDRSQFGLGGKKWADTSVIGNGVPVHIHLVATRAGNE